jgi:hypothetical protein
MADHCSPLGESCRYLLHMSKSDQRKGIRQGDKTRWVIEGLSEFEPFFRHLECLLPSSGAVVYLEGVCISGAVRRFLDIHKVPPLHEVVRGTIWPAPSTFHLPATSIVLSGLAELSAHHATPEIADHCHVYTRDEMILQWYDACDLRCPLGVAGVVPEECVAAFCGLAGATYHAFKNE